MSQEQSDLQLVESDEKNEGLEKSHETGIINLIKFVYINSNRMIMEHKFFTVTIPLTF